MTSEKKDKKNSKDLKNEKRELKDTKQEIMFELKLKTDELLKKLKEASKKDRVSM